MVILYFFLILLMSFLSIRFTWMESEKNPGLHWEGKAAGVLFLYMLAASLLAARNPDRVQGILYSMLFAYLGAASYSDYFTRKVYRFFVYPALGAGIVLVFYQGDTWGQMASYGIYVLLLVTVFRKYLGWGDVLAFAVCGLFFPGKTESTLLCGLFHMGLTLVLAALPGIPAWRRKERRNEKIPLLPYISAGMIGILGYWSI